MHAAATPRDRPSSDQREERPRQRASDTGNECGAIQTLDAQEDEQRPAHHDTCHPSEHGSDHGHGKGHGTQVVEQVKALPADEQRDRPQHDRCRPGHQPGRERGPQSAGHDRVHSKSRRSRREGRHPQAQYRPGSIVTGKLQLFHRARQSRRQCWVKRAASGRHRRLRGQIARWRRPPARLPGRT